MIIEKIKERFIRSNQTSKQQRLGSEDLRRIDWMFSSLAAGDTLARPSRYWEELNKMNLEQLKESGYENFKRTITLNYFTWTRLLPWDSQIVFLFKNLPISKVLKSFVGALSARSHTYYSSLDFLQSFFYNFLSLLQWEYIFKLPMPADYATLQEPEVGNPAIISPKQGMKTSQDIANSLIEFDSLRSALPSKGPITILELGPGYGRNAFVILKLVPGVKYIVVDIPPALWVAERYLSEIFPEKRIFKARDFKNFEEVADEFASAEIVFLLSSQMALLPRNSTDFIINISSLHEMRGEQIQYYFQVFDKILKPTGHFYFKQWKKARVLFEGLTLVEADYPIPKDWKKIFSRTARVQTKFFEALYQKDKA